MTKLKLTSLAIAVIALSGCEQLQQAATDAVDKARQTAVESLDEARQAGSIEEAKQSAGDALQDLRQQAGGLLQQAGEYLTGQQPAQDGEQQAADSAAAVETDSGG